MNPESYSPQMITPESIPKSNSSEVIDAQAEALPKFLPGDRVTVERSGVNGGEPRLEQNWSVEGYDTQTGRVIVTSPDRSLIKKFSADYLESLQPHPGFKEGQSVTVRRYSYDVYGKRVPGETRMESDWSVVGVDHEAGTVKVASPDGSLEKVYSIDSLKAIQSQEVSDSGQPERSAEIAGERLQEIQEDLAEEAFEGAGVAVAAAGRLLDIDQAAERKDPFDYLKKALPPVVRPASPLPDYDRLLSGGAPVVGQGLSFGQYQPETEEDKQRKYYDKFVTEQNRQDAVGTLEEAIKATPQIREVLERFNIKPTSLEAVDAIRENADVRFEVAKILVRKLDRLVSDPDNDLGWRINQNSPDNLKSDHVTGKKMMSRLYAVNMALKMIDGEFSSRHEGSDSIDRDKEGRVAIGQHRHAASSTLMSYV